jgi:ABC-type glycerol-3-phosphate transport system substrate-binding protein
MLSINKMIKLNKAVGSSYLVDLNDIKPVKAALHKLGYYNPPKWGITEIPDKAMMDGIKSFQKDNDLQVDGIMRPEGETETALNSRIKSSSNEEDVAVAYYVCTCCGARHGGVYSPKLCHFCYNKLNS